LGYGEYKPEGLPPQTTTLILEKEKITLSGRYLVSKKNLY
jgi:hypothetical protein